MSGQDVVDLAETQVGTVESPPGSNQVIYWKWWGASLGAWCAVFVSYIRAEAGCPLPDLNPYPDPGGAVGFVSCPSGQAYAYLAGEAVSDPEPGDIAIFSWYPWEMRNGIAVCTQQYAGEAAGDHTGLFVRWNGAPGGSFTACEGNTSNADWSDGGAVMKRSDRHASQVCCWWRHPCGSSSLATASVIEEDEMNDGAWARIQGFLDDARYNVFNVAVGQDAADDPVYARVAARVEALKATRSAVDLDAYAAAVAAALPVGVARAAAAASAPAPALEG